MKTIQEHLRELNRERLIEDYEYRIRERIVEAYCNVEQSDIADLTLEEIYRRTLKNIGEYVDRLMSLETAPLDDGKVGLLYAYDRITDALDCCEFVHLDEVLEHGDAAENYSYKLCSQEQIMGFLVSDDRYTRNHLYDLAVAVMCDRKPTVDDEPAVEREVDRERLIDAYLYRVRYDILDYYRDEESKGHYKTIRQEREDGREFYGAYLDRLRRLKITPPTNGKHGLLYAYKRISDLSKCKPEPCFPYVNLEDLLEEGEDATNYAYDFDLQSDDIFSDWYKDMKAHTEHRKIEEAAEREFIQRRLLLARAIGLIQYQIGRTQ